LKRFIEILIRNENILYEIKYIKYFLLGNLVQVKTHWLLYSLSGN